MKIEVKDLSKSFGKNIALNNVSLSFESGNIYGLLGRNGAGKSTLLNIITEKIYADSGYITIDNEKLIGTSGQHNIHLMTESNFYMTDERVKTIAKFGKACYPNWDQNRYLHLVKAFKLDERKKWTKLSTGYKTIFKVIMAMCSGRKFLFFDEPILGLDANHRDLFYKELLDLYNSNPNICIVLSTHLIEEISKLINKVVIIKNGNIIKNCDIEEITSNSFSVSGKTEDVNKAIVNAEVFSKKIINGNATVKVFGKIDSSNVDVAALDLQETFIELTNEEI